MHDGDDAEGQPRFTSISNPIIHSGPSQMQLNRFPEDEEEEEKRELEVMGDFFPGPKWKQKVKML